MHMNIGEVVSRNGIFYINILREKLCYQEYQSMCEAEKAVFKEERSVIDRPAIFSRRVQLLPVFVAYSVLILLEGLRVRDKRIVSRLWKPCFSFTASVWGLMGGKLTASSVCQNDSIKQRLLPEHF